MAPLSFEARIEHWIRQALSTGIRDFETLVRALPGLSPPETAAALARLDGLPPSLENLPPAQHHQHGSYAWPVPHPLDFDWRFSPDAVDKIFSLFAEFGGADPAVVLLGAPSIFHRALQLRWPGTVWLLDRNPLKFRVADGHEAQFLRGDILSCRVPDLEADLALVDPPWYPEEQLAFLWVASRVLRPGGMVLASGPPAGSRPSAEEEWGTLVDEARSLHLELHSVSRAIIPYLTPPFEANSFRAALSPRFPVDWRRGDLTVFRKTEGGSLPKRPAATPGEAWSNYGVARVRFMVRRDSERVYAAPQLTRLVDGDILRSVSRRDALRQHVAVWTSGNRIYGSDAPQIVATTLEEMACGLEPATLAPRVLRRAVSRREYLAIGALRGELEAVVNKERVEYVDLGG